MTPEKASVLCRAMGDAMRTDKNGGWAHLSCVFWYEKPTFENILMVSVVQPAQPASHPLKNNQMQLSYEGIYLL